MQIDQALLARVTNAVKQHANSELLPRFADVTRQIKADGSFLTEADLAMQQAMHQALAEILPQALFLAEEMPEEQQNALLNQSSAVWCLDPLDGTSNFAAGIPYFAVSLSLIINGEVELAVVFNPVMNECFTGLKRDARLNNQALQLAPVNLAIEKTTAIVDFKRLAKPLATALATEPPFSSQRSFGGVALDWCWLAAGRAHLYLHGKQNIWDYSAGHFIFQQAGGYSANLDGEALYLNRLQPRAAVGAVDEKLFQSWMKWLMQHQ